MPEITQKPSSSKPLLWINKSTESKSLKHSHSDERKEIQSHVQQWRKERVKSVKSRSVKFRRLKSSLVEEEHTPAQHDERRPSTSPAASMNSGRFRWALETPQAQPKSTLSISALKTIHPKTWSLSLPGKALDPFNSASVIFDSQTNVLLQYYLKVVYPSRFHAETRSRSALKHSFNVAENELIRRCISNELHMITLLTAMASRMEHVERFKVQGGTETYMAFALHALQKYVSKAQIADNQLVFDMFHLFTAEAYRFNNSAAIVHLKAAKQIVDCLGGMEKLTPHEAESIVIGDLFIAAEELACPVFDEHPKFDPGPGSSQNLGVGKVGSSQSPGARFRSCWENSVISTQTYQIVEEIVECLEVAECTSNMVEPPGDALRWIHLRNLSIRHRLLSQNHLKGIEKALHVTLQMWLLLSFTWLGPSRTAKVMASKLKQILININPPSQMSAAKDMYAWILSVGAMASRETVHEEWFNVKLISVSGYEFFSSSERLREFSAEFFYLEAIQRPWLERLVYQLRLARAHNVADPV